ncbi:cytochrome P450 [Micromonospora sp. S4605]|uniref:cytochrome P450 n=1 Tax=Micromonospora sp. S4605 TaxID=1420897 RepID=UPI000D702A07|nr:cytochrome P450 [Micromonospora sp. S4605]PWU50571.1 cytochrome P450 [Micromonospora sp. S4605]
MAARHHHGPAVTATEDFLSVVGTPEYVADPYPFLRRLRETAPALHAGSDIWVVPRYTDVLRGLKDPALSCDFARLEHYDRYFRARGVDNRFPLPLNALDPPDHRRIRSAITPEFHPAAVDALRPVITETVDEVLDELEARGRTDIDLVDDVAYPIPVALIARLFGIPRADQPLLRRWSHEFGVASDPDAVLTDAQREQAAEATREAGAYFARLVRRRDAVPGGNLLGRWLAASRDDRTMSLPELLVNGVFLLIVGHHNTVSLIANGMLALLEHPDQLDLLRRSPELMPNAVEELLRYDSPVQTSTRVTTGVYHVDGVDIPAHRQVMLLLGSANRDERVFADPDRLDLRRPEAPRNLGLGRGMHSCLGGTLARIEVGAALAALVRRYPGMSLAGPARRRVPCFTLRGLTSLPVRLG